MTHAWRIIAREAGDPDVLAREEIALPEPGPGEVRIRHTAIGVNYIDTYHRAGLYPREFPSGLGTEAAGVAEALGPGVQNIRRGQRIAYLPSTPSTYATHGIAKADSVFLLPDGVEDATAAAVLLKGLTAWMLVERCAKAQPGDNVLVHAAAGGVGSLLVQWLKANGSTVFAHAGTDAKAATAKSLGAEHAFCCPFEDLAESVRAQTQRAGVACVFDGVGKASWAASLASLAKRGLMVSYGNASGTVPPIAPLELLRGGSLFLTRPSLYDYIDTAEARVIASNKLFTLLESGKLRVKISQRFALADAAAAHRALEGRQTMGSTILIP